MSSIEHELGVRWFAPGELWEYLPPCIDGELTVQVEDRVVVPTTPLRMWRGHDDWDWRTRKGGPWCRWDWRNRATSRTKPIRHRLGNQLQAAFPVEVYGGTGCGLCSKRGIGVNCWTMGVMCTERSGTT